MTQPSEIQPLHLDAEQDALLRSFADRKQTEAIASLTSAVATLLWIWSGITACVSPAVVIWLWRVFV